MAWTPLVLPDLVHEVIEQLQFMAKRKEQHLRLSYSHDLLTMVGDHDRLQQIVLNLVHNALKFTPEKGTVSVKVFCDTPTTLMITVSDTGPGIPEETLRNLFEPFFQVPQGYEPHTMGLGLGLAIVKNLVDLHGGTITVESKMGKGSTFRVSLPTRPLKESNYPPL